MQTLLITGGTGEIGKAIVERFSAEKFNIIAPARTELNLEDNASVEKFLHQLNATVDVFVHCAGFNSPKLIADIALTDIEKTMQINAMSFYKICHDLVKNKKLNSNAFILGVSSIYGFLARKGRFSYSASKHCLNGMVKTLALELGGQNIKVNTVAPGFVDTRMTRQNNDEKTIEGFKQKIPLGRLAMPMDIAEVAYFLCSPANRFLTGQEIVVDGGYSIGGFEQ